MEKLALQTSEALRDLSKEAFNSRYRIEIALTILSLDETFVFDELWERLTLVADASGMEAPSAAKVRVELTRLREVYGALERMPRVKGELIKREVRRDSALWQLCREVYARSSP